MLSSVRVVDTGQGQLSQARASIERHNHLVRPFGQVQRPKMRAHGVFYGWLEKVRNWSQDPQASPGNRVQSPVVYARTGRVGMEIEIPRRLRF